MTVFHGTIICQLKKDLMSYKRSHCNWKCSDLIVNVLIMAEDVGIYCSHTELSAKQRTVTENHLYSKFHFSYSEIIKRKKNLPLRLKAFLPQSSLLSPKSFWIDLALNPLKAGVYSNSSSHSCNRESPIFPITPTGCLFYSEYAARLRSPGLGQL